MSEHDVLLFALPSIRQKGPVDFLVTENRVSSTLGRNHKIFVTVQYLHS